MAQLTLNFDAGISKCYATLREYVATRVHQQGKLQKIIAADMDLSPSHLSRKLAQSPNDTLRLTCDDLENYISTQNDVQPILYLVEKYMGGADKTIEQLERQLAELKGERQ